MNEDAPFDHFYAEGLITDVLHIVKTGKEASVYLCRAHPSTGRTFFALKAYRPRASRGFKNDAIYKEGRTITKVRERHAVEKKTRFGRQLDEGYWVSREYEALTMLHRAGADVPKPIATDGSAILMEFLGVGPEPAPQLRQVALERPEAHSLFDRLMRNVELFLGRNLIHADLSPYNVLYQDGRVLVIDLPQWVDARTNRNAAELLARDVAHLSRHFARFGVDADADHLARDLWRRYRFAQL